MKDYLISVVIPVFNEEKQIGKNLEIIHRILSDSRINHEFVLVDDGSRDNTWKAIKDASAAIDAIHAVRLSKNFGKEAALCAGLDAVQGDACIVMDSDLQHPPALIPEMVRLWKEEGFDVVEGVKSSRGKEKLSYKLSSHLFYRILKTFSGIDLNMASDFRLLDAKVLTAWRSMKEKNVFFRGMSTWVGYKRTSIPFEVASRSEGTSKWSFIRLVKLATNAITAFSTLPLQLVTILGLLFLIGATLLGIDAVYMKFFGNAVSGFTTVILLLLIMGSGIMISLGIIGIYLARIYDEVKNRPRYMVSEEIKALPGENHN